MLDVDPEQAERARRKRLAARANFVGRVIGIAFAAVCLSALAGLAAGIFIRVCRFVGGGS